MLQAPEIEFLSNSPEETKDIGKRMAAFLPPGSTVALDGNLGSGKTHLAKGIALGLGITENITSPTYTIINEYLSNPVLYHIDAYRLDGDKDFEETGGRELLYSGGICIIEWSCRIQKSLPADAVSVSMEITGPCSRLIKIEGLKAAGEL